MSEAMVAPNQHASSEQFAGFWIRVVATIIDMLILIVPSIMLTMLLPVAATRSMAGSWAYWALNTSYFTLFLTGHWQATPGKRIMKIYVGRAGSGERLEFMQSLARYAVLSAPTILFMIASLFYHPPMPPPSPDNAISMEDQQRFRQVMEKQFRKEPLTAGEKDFLDETNRKSQMMFIQMIKQQTHLSDADEQRLETIQDKEMQKLPVTSEEKQFQTDIMIKALAPIFIVMAMMGGLAMLYCLANALMIGLTQQKTGIHDLIARTRAYRGVPA